MWVAWVSLAIVTIVLRIKLTHSLTQYSSLYAHHHAFLCASADVLVFSKSPKKLKKFENCFEIDTLGDAALDGTHACACVNMCEYVCV
jgi:hypothetical protein